MIYDGILDPASSKMSRDAKKAYFCWKNQRSRCLYTKDVNYLNYGAKGISVKYSVREFIGWWLCEHSKKKWVKPSVGRIDHSKNYSFDNIELVEFSDNVREMISRTGGNMTVRPIVLVYPDRVEAFSSMCSAARYKGCDPATFKFRLMPKRRTVRPKQRLGNLDCEVYDFDKFMSLKELNL